MNTTRVFNRQTGIIAMAVALLLATFISALVSAAQVTQRSVQLSSSSVGATDVAYTVNFTAAEAAGAVVIDFCSNSPLVGEACTPPTDFDASAAAAASGFTVGALTAPEPNTVLVTGSVTTAATAIPLTGITNPTTAGSIYARVLTYVNNAAAIGYTPAAPGAYIDQGGMAMSITPTVAISGDVLESLTFCISGGAIAANCTGTLTAPVLELGKDLGNGVKALDVSEISTGTIHTQITTNAVNGAVVNLKSSALGCGGLVNSSKPAACDIKPTLADDLAVGTATFGVKTAASTDSAGVLPQDAVGVLQPFGSIYNNTTYALSWAADNTTGVTSTFGDPFLTTNGEPANNKNMALTFGASVNGNTPAGSYSTNLSLIATGKF